MKQIQIAYFLVFLLYPRTLLNDEKQSESKKKFIPSETEEAITFIESHLKQNDKISHPLLKTTLLTIILNTIKFKYIYNNIILFALSVLGIYIEASALAKILLSQT